MPIGAALAAAAPALIGGIASAGVSAGIGALTSGGSSGAISAGQQQANGLSEATKTEARAGFKPFIGTGTNALTSYADVLGQNGPDAAARGMSQFTASPGYQYQLDQGLKAVDHGAAARGILRSGATLQAEQTLGANLANQDFGSYLGRLNGLAGIGFDGTRSLQDILSGQSTGQQRTDTTAAGAQAGIIDAAGNKLANAAGSGINSLAKYYTDKNDLGSSFGGPGTSTMNSGGFA